MKHFEILSKKSNLINYSLYIFIFFTLFSFVITFILLLPGNELVKNKLNLLLLLSLDTVLVIILIGISIRQIVLIFINKRKNVSTSKLYIKFINLFTLISLGPTIGVIIITALFFNLELRTWYGDAVKSTIVNSNAVANDYLKQKQEILEVNLETISREIYTFVINNTLNTSQLNRIINENRKIKRLVDVYIFNSNNNIIAFSSESNLKDNFAAPSNPILKILNSGQIYITQKNANILSAYYKINYLKDTYILINDDINKTIYNHLFETAKAISAYNASEENTFGLQISFSMIFVLFSICLLLVSIIFGFKIAANLSEPITNLIRSSQKISKGDFNAKVHETNNSDEISILLKSFNKMITDIETQQKQLIDKNIEIENRRLFNEAVLGSLSTGVIALDKKYKITLVNKSAENILHKKSQDLIGGEFFILFKELNSIKDNLIRKLYKDLSQQIEYNIDNNIRNLFVKITIEKKDQNIIGYVVTIDDLTSLILAEKHAAWSDVARKIAHEIKNPLTPIKLSAERISKKIQDNKIEKNNFISLTKTISKQVDDIGKLIDEFSSFARLPKAEIKKSNFILLLKERYNFYSNAHSKINFIFKNNLDNILCFYDEFQLSLVINNITKNAIEAVSNIKNACIKYEIYKDDNYLYLNVIDNGIGVNKNSINKIFQPYFTTKEKGTGLGLSICKKIIEDHGGKIFIKKNVNAGSTITLTLNL